MAIGEICSREVVVAGPEESVREGAELMRLHHAGDVVVVEERGGARVPIGIVTDRDIVVAVVAKGLDPDKLTLRDIVSPELTLAKETLGVAETVELMRAHGIRRVPIVDAAGALVGIVSADDILDLMAEELTALARMVSRQQRREADSRVV